MTRLAITMREVAGPQLSPETRQSVLLAHLYWLTRHMREPLVVPVALQRSPSTPARHVLAEAPVQGLASGTQAFVFEHVLSVYWMVQARRGRTQVLVGDEQFLPVKSQ
jgi:hypothetical protein